MQVYVKNVHVLGLDTGVFEGGIVTKWGSVVDLL